MNQDIMETLKGLSFKEILGYAIHSEDVASNYYWTLANVFEPNELVRAKFTALSNDERLHKEALLHLHQDAFGTDEYVVPEGLQPLESVVDVKTVGSFMEALETAMENENNAYKTYMFLAEQHKEHRKLFRYLAITEKGHYETLKQDMNFFGQEAQENPSLRDIDLSKVYSAPMFRPPDVVR